MKKTAAIAGILMLAGCATSKGEVIELSTTTVVEAPTTTTIAATTTTETTIPPFNEEEFYIEMVKSETDLEWQYNDYDILQFGRGFCDMLDQGYAIDDIFTAMAEIQITEGLSEQFMLDIASAFGMAVPAFCPEYQWMMN